MEQIAVSLRSLGQSSREFPEYTLLPLVLKRTYAIFSVFEIGMCLIIDGFLYSFLLKNHYYIDGVS